MATLGKPQRQHRIARLLEEQVISSQGQLVEMLAAAGVIADPGHGEPRPGRARRGQGADPGWGDGVRGARAREGRGQPRRSSPTGDGGVRRRRRALGATWSVLRTPPGSAHVIGSALDRAGSADVLGTVAGDDTLILVCEESVGGAAVAAQLAQLAGL